MANVNEMNQIQVNSSIETRDRLLNANEANYLKSCITGSAKSQRTAAGALAGGLRRVHTFEEAGRRIEGIKASLEQEAKDLEGFFGF